MKKRKKQIDTTPNSSSMENNPFNDVDFSGLDLNNPQLSYQEPESDKKSKARFSGRVDIMRVKAGRGGKEVTIIKDIPKLHQAEILKELKRKFACGGAIKEETLELQGDKRSQAQEFLKDLGFTVILAGG